MDFKIFMIVFSKSEKRVNNYNIMNEKCNNLIEKFEAIDSINHFDEVAQKCTKDGVCDWSFINSPNNQSTGPGKVGCLASHIYLLKQIKENNYYNCDWFVIFEDDVTIFDNFVETLKSKIPTFEKLNTNFVKLFTDTKDENNKKRQFWHKRIVEKNIYKMRPQYHTLAAMINRKGIDYILSQLPINVNIDLWFTQEHIDNLNAVYWNSNLITNGGALNYRGKNWNLGSLICN